MLSSSRYSELFVQSQIFLLNIHLVQSAPFRVDVTVISPISPEYRPTSALGYYDSVRCCLCDPIRVMNRGTE